MKNDILGVGFVKGCGLWGMKRGMWDGMGLWGGNEACVRGRRCDEEAMGGIINADRNNGIDIKGSGE